MSYSVLVAKFVSNRNIQMEAKREYGTFKEQYEFYFLSFCFLLDTKKVRETDGNRNGGDQTDKNR